jgi:hypothetical protein
VCGLTSLPLVSAKGKQNKNTKIKAAKGMGGQYCNGHLGVQTEQLPH